METPLDVFILHKGAVSVIKSLESSLYSCLRDIYSYNMRLSLPCDIYRNSYTMVDSQLPDLDLTPLILRV